MKHAESVTFGGSDLDRAHDLRGNAAALEALSLQPGARAVVLWRGKPLISGAGRDALVRLALDHPVLAGQVAGAMILLGRENGDAVFAADLSGWDPENLDLSSLGVFLDPTEQRHPALPDDQVFAELRSVMTNLTPRDAELAATAKALFGWHDSHGFCAKCGGATVMVTAGWQRDCPACSAHHFPRTDPV